MVDGMEAAIGRALGAGPARDHGPGTAGPGPADPGTTAPGPLSGAAQRRARRGRLAPHGRRRPQLRADAERPPGQPRRHRVHLRSQKRPAPARMGPAVGLVPARRRRDGPAPGRGRRRPWPRSGRTATGSISGTSSTGPGARSSGPVPARRRAGGAGQAGRPRPGGGRGRKAEGGGGAISTCGTWFVPSGLWHGDHKMTARACLRLVREMPGRRWGIYEELPYRWEVPEQVTAAKQRLAAQWFHPRTGRSPRPPPTMPRNTPCSRCYRSQLPCLGERADVAAAGAGGFSPPGGPGGLSRARQLSCPWAGTLGCTFLGVDRELPG